MKVHAARKLKKLSLGDHACLVYRNKEEYRDAAMDYIIEGLYHNEKVVCVLYEYPRDRLIMDLKEKGIDVHQLLDSNQLVLKNLHEVYIRENDFNPEEAMAYWEEEKRIYKEEGFPAMRIMGEMIFSIYDECGMSKLIQYEILSNKHNPENEIYLCVYNLAAFPSAILEEVIESHNVVVHGGELMKPNPYYTSWEDQLKNYERREELRKRLGLKMGHNTNTIDTNNSRRNRDAAILKYVLGSTGDGVWEWNIESSQIYINKNFFEILGYNHKKVSVSSNNLSRLIHPEDLFGFVNQFKKHFEDEIEYVDYEIRMKSKSGEWVWFRIRGIAVEKNKITGEILKMVGIYIDRREKRQLVNELDEKNAMEKIETDFISNISHELRTPLNVILGSLQLQELYIKSDQSSEYISKYEKINKRMKQNSYRLLRLLNNVIDISKIESGFHHVNLENYDIKMLTEKIVGSIEDYVKNAGLTIRFQSNVDQFITACDPEKIERVLLNILSNAIKFTEAGGNIFVDFKADQDRVIISIKDTGIGIPEDKLGKIFGRFKQVNSLKHRANEGSGIGLSLVKSWVNAHQGEVFVKSKENEGTEFIIRLPNKTIASTGVIKNEVAATKEVNVERLNIEFSDIYS